MHISGSRSAIATQPVTLGKSTEVPPGLARRGLDLPPGIAKKLDDGGVTPAGIAKRFSAPTPVTTVEDASEGNVSGANSTGTTPTSVDKLA